VETAKSMIERFEARFMIKPKRFIGDAAYGTAAMSNWIVENMRIEPHTPVRKKYEGTAERFGMADFAWIVAAKADRLTPMV